MVHKWSNSRLGGHRINIRYLIQKNIASRNYLTQRNIDGYSKLAMIIRGLSLFILTSFMLSLFTMVEDSHNFITMNSLQIKTGDSIAPVSVFEYTESHDSHCSDNTAHCNDHCFGNHFFNQVNSSSLLKIEEINGLLFEGTGNQYPKSPYLKRPSEPPILS